MLQDRGHGDAVHHFRGAPGSIVEVRDEQWVVTGVEQDGDGYLVHVQGLTELVRDTTATFATVLDKIDTVDPAEATVVADDSPGYRRTRLWLEAMLRKSPVALTDPALTVSTRGLADSLGYQQAAVRQALTQRTYGSGSCSPTRSASVRPSRSA